MEKKKINSGFVNVAILISLVIGVMAVFVWQLRPLPSAPQSTTPKPADDQMAVGVVTPAVLPQTEENVKAAATQTTSLVKEIYIPLGQGESTAKEWKDVSGAEAYIDTSKYPEIDSVVFETALHMSPSGTGTAHARLRNVTDGPTVWFSELSTPSVTSIRLESKKISLAAGNKLYRVQMYATHQYPAILDFARIKITLK